MNIRVRKIIEHKDGSATCDFVFDKEAHHVLLRHGLISILLAVSARYKPTKTRATALAKKKVVAKKKAK